MAWCFKFVSVYCLLTWGILKIYRFGRRDKREDHRHSRVCQEPKPVETTVWDGLWHCGSQIPSSHTTSYWELEWLVSGRTANAAALGACWYALIWKTEEHEHDCHAVIFLSDIYHRGRKINLIYQIILGVSGTFFRRLERLLPCLSAEASCCCR